MVGNKTFSTSSGLGSCPCVTCFFAKSSAFATAASHLVLCFVYSLSNFLSCKSLIFDSVRAMGVSRSEQPDYRVKRRKRKYQLENCVKVMLRPVPSLCRPNRDKSTEEGREDRDEASLGESSIQVATLAF